MKSERKEALLAIKENIEMKLFSSEELCTVIQTQEEKEDHTVDQRQREHPLDVDGEEEPAAELKAPPKQQQPKTQTRTPTHPRKVPLTRPVVKPCRLLPVIREEVEIEMEPVPPIRIPRSEHVEPSSNKVTRLKWRRQALPKAALLVRDVVCLPRGHYLTQPDRHTVKERSPPGAKGITARITIDSGWSASQMHSRLVLLFCGWFTKGGRGQRFSFTYLQCTQGSRVLFVPDTPPEGWTGRHVLRISESSPLYIISHHDYLQAKPEKPVRMSSLMRKPYLETPTMSCTNEQKETARLDDEPQVIGSPDKGPLNLDTVLGHFRQRNQDHKAKAHLHMRRKELLRGTLKAMRGPEFNFRKTPVVIFTGSDCEDDGEEPTAEFFRLALQELQRSEVFEGPPGRVFFTYDLTALEQRKYFEAGVLIGWSMAQGGPGPRFLHPALFQMMCGQNPSLEDFSWTDIPDPVARLRLKQLQSCSDVKQLPAALRAWMSSSGIPGISSAHSGGIPSMYCQMVKHYIYHRVASMISQFKEGLNSCAGLWDMVQSHWKMFLPVMTGTQQKPQTLEEFRQLFTACFSHPDHWLREEEELTAQQWDAVLALVRDRHAEFSFEDLLNFITGAEHLHPLGLSSQISLRFYSQDKGMSSVRLPYSSPSALELYLPRGVGGAAELLSLLSKAVLQSQGQTHSERGTTLDDH